MRLKPTQKGRPAEVRRQAATGRGSIFKRVVVVFVLALLVINTGWSQKTKSAAVKEEVARAPHHGSEAVHRNAGRDGAQELEDIEDRQGPFPLAGQEFTVVLHYKRSPHQGGLDSRALVSLDIRDAAGAVQYHESFPYEIEGGAFSETCSAGVRLLRGSNGAGLLIESGCLPSAPLAGGPWRILGVVGGRLVSFGKPLVTEGEWGEFVPGAVSRTGKMTLVLPDGFRLRVWTGYFFVSVPVRIDWREGKLALGQRCLYQTGHGFAEGGCEMPVDEAPVIRRQQQMTFVRMFHESNERSGPPAHVVVKTDSKVEIVASKVAVIWNERPEAVSISAGEDVWVKIRIDGQEGWIHTPEDLNALGLFASG
jgi:hypothetical protein